MKKFKPIEHPSIKECIDGHAAGSDYKYDVLLKEGWRFRYGRMRGCRSGFFHTVADFKHAKPTKEKS